MAIISISLPETLVRKIDSHVVGQGYRNRSDFIRHVIEQALQETGEVGGGRYRLIVVMSDHEEVMYVDRNIVSLIHGYSDGLKALYHQLLDSGLCITVSVTEEKGDDWRILVKRLRGLRGVKNVHTTVI